jgi:type I restriction enzyme, S subunit
MNVVARLDEVCNIIMGQAPSGDAYNTRGDGWPLIAGAGDFRGSLPDPKKFTTVASKLSKPGDIILGIRASIGDKVLSDGEYCLGRGVAALRPKFELDQRFLWQWLSHNSTSLVSKGKGATFKQVNRQDIGEIPIHLPPLPLQRRIAQVLDSVDALRAKRHKTIALLNDLAQSIFLDMFGDPVSNFKGWPMVRLTKLGSLDRGVSKHRPRNAPELLGGKYPLIQTGDVATSQDYITEWKATYSDIGLAQSKIWPSGTLCITIAANIAKTGILNFDACFPDSVVGFSSTPDIVEYVQVWLSFHQENLEHLAPESAQKNINLAVLRGLNIPNPGSSLISSFAERIRAANTLKAAIRSHLAELDALFASLQCRAFRGELWVDSPAA